MPTYRCNTHRITLEVTRESPDHGEKRTATFTMPVPGGAGTSMTKHPCVMLLAREITPGKMKLSEHLPGHVFGECDVTEVG